MKKFIIFFLSILMFMSINVVSVLAEEKQQVESTITQGVYDPDGKVIIVKAKGLVCAFCATSLEKVFFKEDSVSGMGIDLTTKEILINLKKGHEMSDALITEKIEWGGYNVESIIRQ